MEAIEIEKLASKIAKKIRPPGRWMYLSEAASYSKIGQERLLDLVKNKKIGGFRDLELKTKPWVFDKKSIDRYREQQALLGISPAQATDKKAALEICRAMGL